MYMGHDRFWKLMKKTQNRAKEEDGRKQYNSWAFFFFGGVEGRDQVLNDIFPVKRRKLEG